MTNINHPVVFFTLAMLFITFFGVGCADYEEGLIPSKSSTLMSDPDFKISSTDFTELRPRKRIPLAHTCYGKNRSLSLRWTKGPHQTASYALIMEDIDYKIGKGIVDPGGVGEKVGRTSDWAHWIIYNIPPSATELLPGIPAHVEELPDGSFQGMNDFKNIGYEGPCPTQVVMEYSGISPRTDPAHRYVFTLYALDVTVDLFPAVTKEQLLSLMDGHILSKTHTVGKFQIGPTTDAKLQQNRPLYREFSNSNITSTKR